MRASRALLAACLATIFALASWAALDAPSARSGDTRPCTPMAAGDHQLSVDPDRAPVLLHIPSSAATGTRLVVALPGAGQTGSGFAAYTGYSKLADARGFAVAYPTAAGARPFWNVSGTMPDKPDDVAYLRRVIAAAVVGACADPLRVGITGVSNGGGMAARMACESADLLAAAAPVAGGYSTLPTCLPPRPLPILEIHGTHDQIVPYRGKSANSAGSVLRFLGVWRTIDKCPSAAVRRTRASGIETIRWIDCAGGTIVAHDRLDGVSHGWPGEDDVDPRSSFSTTQQTWRFLSAFRR